MLRFAARHVIDTCVIARYTACALAARAQIYAGTRMKSEADMQRYERRFADSAATIHLYFDAATISAAIRAMMPRQRCRRHGAAFRYRERDDATLCCLCFAVAAFYYRCRHAIEQMMV